MNQKHEQPARPVTEPTLQRRQLLSRIGQSGLALAATGASAWWFYDRPIELGPKMKRLKRRPALLPSTAAQLAIVKSQKIGPAVRQAVDLVGGINAYVKPGDRVVIKPNVGWDRAPELGANTHPLVVAELVKLASEAKAAKVIVTDFSVDDGQRCFHHSGILEAVRQAGGNVDVPRKTDFVPVDLGGKILGVWPVLEQLIEADVLINVPVVKHHSLSSATLAMKNWYGAIGGPREQLHQNIHMSVVDLAAAFGPALNVLDATRIMIDNGPSGGSLDDVEETWTVAASVDPVALDTFGAKLLGLRANRLRSLSLGRSRGLGTPDLSSLRVKEVTL